MGTPPLLGERWENALAYASRAHAMQVRKGTAIPYVSHLLSVSALVLEHGGDDEQAIAALLHDAVEDQGGAPRLADIRQRFGERVAGIVEACTDTDVIPKPPWRERKQTYLDHLPRVAPEALLVSMADKLHNLRCILADYRVTGEVLWERFTGEREGTLWYYRSLTDVYRAVVPGRMSRELDRTLAELERLVREGPALG